MPVRAAYLRTISGCFYCGSFLLARVGTLVQRCPNDCASGLGRAPAHRLFGKPCGEAHDTAGIVRADLIKGEFTAR